MELMYPQVIFIGIPIAIALTFFTIKRKDVFRKGKKVANTGFVEQTALYKKLVRQYKCFSILSLVFLWLSLIFGIIMLARPVKVDVVQTNLHNRDIFICMDISDSVDELNLDICKELKDIVKELDGERFGITIFNGQSVLLVPLTSDYDYILNTLDKLETAFEYSIAGKLNFEHYDLYQYKYEGTLIAYGSSLIGDGLASCLYNFPDLNENEERSRLIIFTTDNELNGEPLVTVEEAAALCFQNDVKVFGVVPEDIVDEDTFRNAMIRTGGGFYEVTSDKVFDKLTNDIRLTDTSTMEDIKVIITDKPQLFFICMLISLSMYFIFSRKVKL